MALHRVLRRIIERWHTLVGPIWNPYRPELHYMRGPGPRWHAKQRRLGRFNAV
jgi:hypothetical protein